MMRHWYECAFSFLESGLVAEDRRGSSFTRDWSEIVLGGGSLGKPMLELRPGYSGCSGDSGSKDFHRQSEAVVRTGELAP